MNNTKKNYCQWMARKDCGQRLIGGAVKKPGKSELSFINTTWFSK